LSNQRAVSAKVSGTQ